MAALNEYSQYEYAISVGEGRLFAYGISDHRRIRELADAAVKSYGNANIVTNVAIPSTETGTFVTPLINQLF